MNLTIISYADLLNTTNNAAIQNLEKALLQTGIVGVSNIPQFETKTRQFIEAARKFSRLDDATKQKYMPNRDVGETEGYELGAEWFKNEKGEWKIDDKKASYYANIPDSSKNKWPKEMELRVPYLELGELIFNTGKALLNFIGLNNTVGLDLNKLRGVGRMLHYHKENETYALNPNWCGAHFDHGVFTGLIPAYYFQDDNEVDEPEEAGLHIIPTGKNEFEKIHADDKSILLFQVGEFGQLISNDKIMATKHMVKKARNNIERFTFAVFYSADNAMKIKSHSKLIADSRYADYQENGCISYEKWENASFDRYRASDGQKKTGY